MTISKLTVSKSSISELSISELPVEKIKGVGPAMKIKLAKLGINSILDLLFHLPIRYEDRTTVYPIASIKNGQSTLIHAEVVEAKIVFGKRRSLVCKVVDQSGFLTLRFFYFSAAHKKINYQQAVIYLVLARAELESMA